MHYTIHFWNPYDKTNNLTLRSEKSKHVSIFDPCGIFKVNAAILEMSQYVAYQKNVAYFFIKLSAKSPSFNILCTMDVLSCPTKNKFFERDKHKPRVLVLL